ncbi:UDP-glucose dehydrogenase [Faunimonas pinastri]|uniref:UDP-glucose 6-dehydrogenase n=1 Tax=Faunimonas pinastri TaxID=1855383 RepID=A0A1H9IDC3_9HYPH|nr:UDP-glucose/GDP-mannose dehydrogenase family protein [Faunimonas pinastri]SEQ72711.1 UDP-glucose dehydrogenase [Faunimonas pinastri]
MRVAVIGAGYVGLVSGACFAEMGHEVVCLDKDPARVASLLGGRVPIYEPGLDEMVRANVQVGRLSFSTDLAPAVRDAEVVLIAVGTPARHSDGRADLSYVYGAAREIAEAVAGYTVIVTKSTVPVGTGDAIERIIRRHRPEARVAVVSNPEFLREGAAIGDFMEPDRVVVGTEDSRARAVMAELYRPLAERGAPVLMTGRRTSELIKYTANAFLAMKITFINEIADLCESVHADIADVADGVGLDSRIGARFLQAGPGYGGSCFPKDTLALLRTAQDYGVSLRLVEDTVSVNDARKRAMARKVIEALGGSVEGLTVAVLGLTFKPDTDDMREAPSLSLIDALQRGGARIHAHDPAGMEQARQHLEDVAFFADPYRCAAGADAVVLMTEWQALCSLDLALLREAMAGVVFVDLRNAYPEEQLLRHGFFVSGIGSAPKRPRPQVVAADGPAMIDRSATHFGMPPSDDEDDASATGRQANGHSLALTV